MFEFITPEDILPGHRNFNATYIVSSTNCKRPKVVHVDKLKLVNSFTGQH